MTEPELIQALLALEQAADKAFGRGRSCCHITITATRLRVWVNALGEETIIGEGDTAGLAFAHALLQLHNPPRKRYTPDEIAATLGTRP